MDNDELDNLFALEGDSNEDNKEAASNEDAAVVESSESEVEVTIIEEDDDLKEELSKEAPKPKKETSKKTEPSKKSKKPSSKESDDKKKKREESRKETIKDIEEFEALLEKKRQDMAKARQERRENYVSLKERTYLEDFPLNFKQIIILLVGALILAVSLCIALMPSLRLRNYVIEGNYQVSDEEVIELLGLNEGDHLFRSYYSVESRIKRTTPYIRDINISFQYPSTLKVTIVERVKIAYIRTADGFAAIDKDGIVLELCSDYEEDVHPVLCGLEINNVVLGQDIGVTDDLSFQKMVVILGAVLSAEQNSAYSSDYSFFESLQEVRILPSGMIFITVELPNGNLLTVKLDDLSTIDDKMHWLLYAIEEGGMNKLPAGSLDMTEESPIYHQYETYG